MLRVSIELMCFTLVCFTVMLTTSILLLNLVHWLCQKNFWFTLLYKKSYDLFFQQLLCVIIYPFLTKPLFSQEISLFSAPNNFSDTISADSFKIYVPWWQKYLKGPFQEAGQEKTQKSDVVHRGQQLEMCSNCVLHGLCKGTGRVSCYCHFYCTILWSLLFKWFC